MKIEDISVAIRLTEDSGSKLRARADVVLPVEGFIELFGFSVIESASGSLFVKAPSRKSQDKYFETVTLRGKIKGLIDQAILAEYSRTTGADNTVSFRRGPDARRA